MAKYINDDADSILYNYLAKERKKIIEDAYFYAELIDRMIKNYNDENNKKKKTKKCKS